MRKALAVGRKEFRQIARDRRSLMVLLFVPAFFLLLYGYALSFDVQNIQLAIHDSDRSQASRELVNAFVKSGYFQLAADVSSSREYEELIDRGEVRAVLVIPGGLQRDLLTGHRVPVQVIINGDNSNTATTVMGYALSVLRTASAEYQVRGATGPTAPVVGSPAPQALKATAAIGTSRAAASRVRRVVRMAGSWGGVSGEVACREREGEARRLGPGDRREWRPPGRRRRGISR